MAGNSKITPAERKRRSDQSARDKASSKPSKSIKPSSKPRKSLGGRAGKPPSTLAVKKAGIHPYTKLILDPCHASLTRTPLPGREGSSIFRLPFRFVVTAPTSSTGLNGGNYANTTPCTSLTAVLTPSATVAGVGATTTTVVSAAVESQVGGYVVGQYGAYGDPVGLAQLNTASSLIRPVAGCIKMEFYSGTNSGSFMGIEGVAGDYITHFGQTASDPAVKACFVPTISNSQIAMTGWTTNAVSQGVEACVNYAGSTDTWQTFRSVGNVPGDTVTADAGDLDFSQMPFAMVGVAGAIPGTQYLVSGAVVYEWVPSISFGLAAAGQERPVSRETSVLEKVAKQIAAYGPMLVGAASKLAIGGPSLALSDLLYRLSLNNNNTGGQIGW